MAEIVDERFALHNVLYNVDTQKMIIAMMKTAFAEHTDTPVSYNVFHGDPEAMVKEPEPESSRVAYDFSTLMRIVNEANPDHDPEPDYNNPKAHLQFIDATLLWGFTTPQLLTNRVWCVLPPAFVVAATADVMSAFPQVHASVHVYIRGSPTPHTGGHPQRHRDGVL